MKALVEANSGRLKGAINFHCYGNLFILPNNWDPEGNSHMEGTEAMKIYREIYTTLPIPFGSLFGNGISTIKYSANGEASDWMLA